MTGQLSGKMLLLSVLRVQSAEAKWKTKDAFYKGLLWSRWVRNSGNEESQLGTFFTPWLRSTFECYMLLFLKLSHHQGNKHKNSNCSASRKKLQHIRPRSMKMNRRYRSDKLLILERFLAYDIISPPLIFLWHGNHAFGQGAEADEVDAPWLHWPYAQMLLDFSRRCCRGRTCPLKKWYTNSANCWWGPPPSALLVCDSPLRLW